MMKLNDAKDNYNNSMELGEVIDEVEQPLVETWEVTASWLFTAVLLGGAFYLGMGGVWSGIIVAVLVSAVGGVMTVAHKLSGKTGSRILRIHENGLCFVQADVLTEIHYCHLDVYCCKKTSVYTEGRYVRDNFELEMKSFSFGNPRTIVWCDRKLWFEKVGQQIPIDFDELHLRISEKVAENMAARLRVNSKIPWGKSNFICKNGIECKVKTGFLSAETRFIPWSELRGMKFQAGKLFLSLETENWNINIPCNEPNLFPGYLLIDGLTKARCSNSMISRQTEEEIATALADPFVVPINV